MGVPDRNDRRLACPKCSWNHVPELQPLPEALYKGDCRRCGAAITFRPSDTLLAQEITINGKQYTVSEPQKDFTLNRFIRDVAGLPGTKFMCNEAGCGVCVVAATCRDVATGQDKTMAVNSCLQPMRGCLGWKVETIEGLGNQKDGLHPIQQRVADNNATQCGYCTPGMVMNMYSLLKANDGHVTQQQVEDSFDGNICRCTGYRPILDTMKSFATDSTNGAIDIEDLSSRIQCCKKNGPACTQTCSQKTAPGGSAIPVSLQDALWQTPYSLEELRSVLKATAGKKVRLVAGNTGIGVFKNDGPYDVYINLRGIAELNKCTVDKTSVTLGGSVGITDAIRVIEDAAANPGFEHLHTVVKHFKKIGNLPLRNASTFAGNFMMKWAHNAMASDVFVVFEALQVKVNIGTAGGENLSVTPVQFLTTDMDQKFIQSFTMGPLTEQDHYRSTKITPRSQNSRSYVNCGFRMKLDAGNNYTVLDKPAIVFGNIAPDFTHAAKTEEYLVGKELANNATIQGAMQILDGELQCNEGPALASAVYRTSLAKSFFYKFILHTCSEKVSEQFRSGGNDLVRPLSSGKQEYEIDKTMAPIGEPIMKISSKIQATGEAEYTGNLPAVSNQLYAAFVLSSEGNATVDKMDASKALAIPGVERFLTADDIPGVNNFMNIGSYYTPEELLCSGQVLYAGQPLGIIVADSAQKAEAAAKLVVVTYRNVQKPVLTTREAIAQESFFPKFGDNFTKGDPDGAMANSYRVFSDSIELGTQNHFTMETQTVVCFPRDNGIDVHACSQWCDTVQQAVAQTLNIKNSDVHVQVKRVGGGFGAKINRTNMVAAGCALACKLLERPVRCQLSMADNSSMLGGRDAAVVNYTVGVTEEGRLSAVKVDFFLNNGITRNDTMEPYMGEFADSAYQCDNWTITCRTVKTNTPSTTWFRGPGSVAVVYAYEAIIEQIAKELGKDPLALRMLNLYTKEHSTPIGQALTHCNLTELMEHVETSAQVQQRKKDVENYNKANRWKKKGLCVMPMKFSAVWNYQRFHVQVRVYNGDGTVGITHGGVEIGQGINTKIIQVCARELGIPVTKITVRPTNTEGSSNSEYTGGSTTSELNALGVIECCKQIRERMEKFDSQLAKDATWEERVTEFYEGGGDLTGRYWVSTDTPQFTAYFMYGAVCTEVDLDVLTGQYLISRVDLLYDCGKSMNPAIDIGQVEGAFVMGLGYYLMEKTKYDPKTGANLTNTTWEYKPPTTKDIPVDFRIELLKNRPNPLGILSGKATGEPPLVMSCSAVWALHQAISSARADAGNHSYFHLDIPATVCSMQPICLTKNEHYTLG